MGNDSIFFGVSGAVIVILMSVVAYFVKGRDRRIRDLESGEGIRQKEIAMISSNLETIAKRLSAGADSFKDINSTQKVLQETQTYIIMNYLRRGEFEKYNDRHNEKHDKLDKTIEDIKASVLDMKTTLIGMEQKFSGGIKTMTDMLSKVVTIPIDPGDRL